METFNEVEHVGLALPVLVGLTVESIFSTVLVGRRWLGT